MAQKWRFSHGTLTLPLLSIATILTLAAMLAQRGESTRAARAGRDGQLAGAACRGVQHHAQRRRRSPPRFAPGCRPGRGQDSAAGERGQVRKRGAMSAFYLRMIIFTKTGSGKTQGKRKNKAPLSSRDLQMEIARLSSIMPCTAQILAFNPSGRGQRFASGDYGDDGGGSGTTESGGGMVVVAEEEELEQVRVALFSLV